MQLTSTDRALVEQSKALAAAHTETEMRVFLRENGHPNLAQLDGYGNLAAACLGIAQHNLRVLAGYLTEDGNDV